MRKKIKEVSTSVIWVTIAIIVFLIISIASKGIIAGILNLVWANDDLIFVSPNGFAYDISYILLLVSIVSIYHLVKIPIKGIKFPRQFSIKRRRISIATIYLFILTGTALPAMLVLSAKVFSKNSIKVHNGFTFETKTYRYSEVKKVCASRFRGAYTNSTNYELVMKDGKEINLTSDEYHMKYIFDIETRLSENLPHEITKEAYRYFVKTIPKERFDILNWSIIN